MRIETKRLWLIAASVMAALLSGAGATQTRGLAQSSYAVISTEDLQAFVESLPQLHLHNQVMRAQLIAGFKKRYALAQAAEAEGLDKGEDFGRNFALTTARLLAQEHSKRNPTLPIGRPEIDAYVAARQKAFDSDLAFFTKNNHQAPSPEQLESYKTSWGELQIRAGKARAAGIEKEPATQLQLKLVRAELLANLYATKLQKQFEPTAADYQSYYAQHPEADPEKIRQRVAGLLTRLKNGEAFEKIADEVNDDGTRGRGGDLDWCQRGILDPDFERAAWALRAGQVSEVVQSAFGYHLIKVEARRQARNRLGRPNPHASPGEQDELKLRHIYLSAKVAEEAVQQQFQEKIKSAIQQVEVKYPVAAPEDFPINKKESPTPPPPATPKKRNR